MQDWQPRIDFYSYEEYRSALDQCLAQLIRNLPSPDDAYEEFRRVRAHLRMLYPHYHQEEIRRRAHDT